MTVSSVHQLNFFLFSIAAGAGLGFFYIFLGEIRRQSFGKGGAFTDILFWVAAAWTAISMGFKLNDGGIRGYQLFGLSCGFFLCFLCAGVLCRKICRCLVKFLCYVLYPVFFIMRGFSLYVKSIGLKLRRIGEKIKKNRQKVTLRNKTRKKIRKKYKKML